MANSTWIPRLLGVATAAYGAAIVAKPALMAGPTKLAGPRGEPSPGVRLLITSIGVRDVASGLAMLLAPAGAPLRAAIAVRVASDVGDAVVLGVGLPDPGAKRKSAAVAGGWAALCALSVLAAGD